MYPQPTNYKEILEFLANLKPDDSDDDEEFDEDDGEEEELEETVEEEEKEETMLDLDSITPADLARAL